MARDPKLIVVRLCLPSWSGCDDFGTKPNGSRRMQQDSNDVSLTQTSICLGLIIDFLARAARSGADG